MAEAASTAKGAWRSLLGFMEAQGKSSNRCIPCQYSEKVSVDEPDPNCYLIVLAWIPNGTGLYLNKYLWNKEANLLILESASPTPTLPFGHLGHINLPIPEISCSDGK